MTAFRILSSGFEGSLVHLGQRPSRYFHNSDTQRTDGSSKDNRDRPTRSMTAIPGHVSALAQERAVARIEKDFTRSDQLRDEIAATGWLIKDTAEGYSLIQSPPFSLTK